MFATKKGKILISRHACTILNLHSSTGDATLRFLITGVRKKIGSVTREARNVRFFWASRSLFLDYKFKRFLQWLEFKWSFAKLKEEILIGEQCFSAVFC